jgi:hypothetical protein
MIINPYIFAGSLLLDIYSAETAYSIRLLSSNYSGALVRVRRSSDSAEKDFYPDGSDELSMSSEDGAGTSLSTWISTDTGYVTTWYNQGNLGSGYDATQATAGSQPILVNAGTIVTQGGKTAIQHREVPNELIIEALVSYSPISLFGVQTIDGASSDATWLMPFTTASAGKYISAASNGSGAAPNSNVGTPTWYVDGTEITSATRDKIYDQLADNVTHLQTILDATVNTAKLTTQYTTSGFTASGNYQESIIFTDDQSSNKTDIESNINTYYSIW